MAIIYLIRHGQASFGKDEYDRLSSLGDQQATRLGGTLATRLGRFGQVYRGSMLRHQQTAELCLKAANEDCSSLPMQVDAGWNEYDHQNILGCYSPEFATPKGLKAYIARQKNPLQAFEKVFDQAMQRWMSGEHQGYVESWLEYQSRINQALAAVVSGADKAEVKNVVVFTSGGPIALLSQQLLGVPAKDLMSLNWNLLNCGLSKLISGRNGVRLLSLNEHSAFEGEFRHLLSYR